MPSSGHFLRPLRLRCASFISGLVTCVTKHSSCSWTYSIPRRFFGRRQQVSLWVVVQRLRVGGFCPPQLLYCCMPFSTREFTFESYTTEQNKHLKSSNHALKHKRVNWRNVVQLPNRFLLLCRARMTRDANCVYYFFASRSCKRDSDSKENVPVDEAQTKSCLRKKTPCLAREIVSWASAPSLPSSSWISYLSHENTAQPALSSKFHFATDMLADGYFRGSQPHGLTDFGETPAINEWIQTGIDKHQCQREL